MSTVGIIGDTHWPACHDRYAEFCDYVFRSWSVDRVVHIGDGCDYRAISFHSKEVGIENIEDEMDAAHQQCQEFVKLFPEVDYLTGNHSDLPYRQHSRQDSPEGS